MKERGSGRKKTRTGRFARGAAQELIEVAEVRQRDVDARRGGLVVRRRIRHARFVASIAASERVR